MDDWENRWYVEPLTGGEYPSRTADEMGWDRSEIRPGDADLISQPVDFLGVNYYTRTGDLRGPGLGAGSPPAADRDGLGDPPGIAARAF